MDLSRPKTKSEKTVDIAGLEGITKEFLEQCKYYKAQAKEMTREKMVEMAQREQDLPDGCYNGPAIAAEEMAKFYPLDERPQIKILDVAAGTGKVGVELAKLGFKKIDALEPSREMLNVLLERKIYDRTYESAIGYKPVAQIPADFYDALVVSGGMGEGRIPISAIDEFLRIVRPGGLFYIVMREEYLTTVAAYDGKLEPFMESLVDKGLWIQVRREVVPNYSFNKKGVVYVYEKTE